MKLENVYLEGILKMTCPKCGKEREINIDYTTTDSLGMFDSGEEFGCGCGEFFMDLCIDLNG